MSERHTRGTNEIKTFFAEALPNGMVNNDKRMNYKPLIQTTNVRSKASDSIIPESWNINLDESVKIVDNRQALCESVGSGDQFDHLSSLAANEDTSSRVRCGWVYNSSNPANGRGALGVSDGPFRTEAKGQWMWNLNKAKEKYHVDICKKVQGCSDIDSDIYKRRCGWCTRSGKAVPVAGGQLSYPANTNTACPSNSLILRSDQCPRPPPITDPSYVRTPAEVCSPMPNGALGRACLLQKVTAAGCSDKGALFQALRSGSDNDYTNTLAQQQAFKTYQERAAIPMDPTALKTGKMTVSDALNTFNRVQDLAASTANSGLQFAARDLCLNKGALDQYDFCTELQDSTAGPFTLDCLQKVFLRMGGQKAGVSYPNTGNIAFYNRFTRWIEVKRYIQSLIDKTKSQVRKDQEYGMMEIYGIKMQNKSKPLPYGPEIAYRTSDMTVLLACERRLPIPAGYTLMGCTNDADEMLDTAAERFGYTMGTPPPPPFKKVPNVDWAGNDIYHTTGQTLEQCQAECAKRPDCVGHNYVYGSPNKDCWIKNNLQNRWESRGLLDFYIKQPTQCKAPYGNPAPEVAGWKYKGCWRDCHQGRGLPHYLGQVSSVDQCISKAKAAGYNTSGNQYFGECWAGNNTDWNKMGDAGCCEPIGGGCTQQIYSSQ